MSEIVDQKADDAMLMKLLALTDAIWCPLRDFDSDAPANVEDARNTYTDTGILWPGGGSEADRKRNQRTLDRLVEADLAFNLKIGSVVYAVLTDSGEARARDMAGLPGLKTALSMVAWLDELSKSPCGWVGEERFSSKQTIRELSVTQECFLSALCRGLAESGSTICRSVRYRTTAKGLARIADMSDAKLLDVSAPSPLYAEHHWRLYEHAWRRTRKKLSTDPPRDEQAIGLMPLPAGVPDDWIGNPEPKVTT